MWIYTGYKLAKFHGNILSLSENIAKGFLGATFLTHTVRFWISRKSDEIANVRSGDEVKE